GSLGDAVEGAMNTVLTVEVVKGVFCDWPRLENDDSSMVAGSYWPLEDAYRIAHTQIIQWLAKDTGLSIMDTYQLVPLAHRQCLRCQLHRGRQGAQAVPAEGHSVDEWGPREDARAGQGRHGQPAVALARGFAVVS